MLPPFSFLNAYLLIANEQRFVDRNLKEVVAWQ